MEAAARAALILVGVALFVNLAQGGSDRVKRWGVRTVTGKDLAAPIQGPPRTTATPSQPASAPARAATPTHFVMV